MKKFFGFLLLVLVLIVASPAVAKNGFDVTLDQARGLIDKIVAIEKIYLDAPGESAKEKSKALEESGQFNLVFLTGSEEGMILIKDGFAFMLRDHKVYTIQNTVMAKDTGGILWRFFPSHHDRDTYFYKIDRVVTDESTNEERVAESIRVNMQLKSEGDKKFWSFDFAFYDTSEITFSPFTNSKTGQSVPQKETLGLALDAIYSNFFVKHAEDQDEIISMYDFAYGILTNEGFKDTVKQHANSFINILREES